MLLFSCMTNVTFLVFSSSVSIKPSDSTSVSRHKYGSNSVNGVYIVAIEDTTVLVIDDLQRRHCAHHILDTTYYEDNVIPYSTCVVPLSSNNIKKHYLNLTIYLKLTLQRRHPSKSQRLVCLSLFILQDA